MRRLAVAIFTSGLVGLLGLPAGGAGPSQVRIREAALDPGGQVRLVVSITGEAASQKLAASSFSVTEEGEAIEGLKVEPLASSSSQPVGVALAIDVSGSTKGKPLVDAKAAAGRFVSQLPDETWIALVAFGATAELKTDLTGDRRRVISAIDSLVAAGETALYDGIALAASTLSRLDGQRHLVVFSDGKDTVSRASMGSAIEAAKAVKAPVTTVALETADFDRVALERIASETEGSSFAVAQSGDLSTAFGQVARDIASTYVLTYSASRTAPADLNLVVTVALASGRESDTITVSNPRVATPVNRSAPQPAEDPGILSSSLGLYLGIAAAFGALALLLGMLFFRPRAGGLQVLRKSLRLSGRTAKKEEDLGIVASNLARRAVELVDRAPKPKGFEERLQLTIERAGWPVRASEFLVLQVLAAIICAFLGVGLFGSVVLGVLLAGIGFWMPRLILKLRVQRRASAFLSQLPETLQLLAGSLQAGYGILQAIDMVAKESPSPTSSEFARVLTEARLGMPLEEAMEGMAERLGSEDFRWVVMAINIQRQVGGNLAQLLMTVAATLRERDQLRRQVKVLSAEGRLSALILTLLPFLLAGYMAMVNREYLEPLLTTGIGRLMVVMALGMIGAGVVWMRKMIKIEI